MTGKEKSRPDTEQAEDAKFRATAKRMDDWWVRRYAETVAESARAREAERRT